MDEKLIKSAELAAELMASSHREGYKYAPTCGVCSAVSKKTDKNIRVEIDAAVMNTQKAKSGLDVCAAHGLPDIKLRQMQAHIQNHSPFVRLGVESKEMRKNVNMAIAEHVAAKDGLQQIVNKGMEMVRDGTLPITERVFLTAIKEANKNHQVSEIEKIAKDLERKLFDRKVIKPEVKEILEGDVIEGEVASD